MRTLFAALFLFGSTALGASAASAEPPSRFEVPRVSDGRAEPRLATHEVLLPADVVARPGESPAEALARALDAAEPRAHEGKAR
jgi:hypothetical protein